MMTFETRQVLNTWEGYEQFITGLLEPEEENSGVDLKLEWEDAVFDGNLLIS